MGNVHYVGAELLTFERIEEILTGNMKLELTPEVKERIQRCRDYLDRKIETVAICTGSGKSMIGDVMAAGADVYVTGDIDYHTAIDTMADGMAIVDAGHYGTEYIFAEAMEKELNEAFPALKTTCASVKNPYTVL